MANSKHECIAKQYQLDVEESKRLNTLKVLMCIFVLLIHSYSDNYTVDSGSIYGILNDLTFILSRIICDCAVPVFITISSILLYSKPISFLTNLKKKLRTLLVPYVVFNTLWILVLLLKQLLGITGGEDTNLLTFSLFDWLDAYLGLAEDYQPVHVALWYIRELFILNLLAIPIKKLVDILPIPTLAAVLLTWIFGIQIPGLNSYASTFFILGCYIVKYQIHLTDLDTYRNKLFILIAYLILLAADIYLMRQSSTIHRLFIFASVVFWFCYSGRLGISAKFIELTAPATFLIYLAHLFFYVLFQVAAGDRIEAYLVFYVVKPVITLMCILGAYYFMKKYLPGFLAVLMGGRIRNTSAGLNL